MIHMENRNDKAVCEISLTDGEKVEYLKSIRTQLIKLLTLIEAERDGGASARLFFGGLLFDIGSADWLYGNRLSTVIVKLHGLYLDDAYLTLEHRIVRNKIFESRGVINGLIRELEGTAAHKTPKNKGE